MEGFYSVDKLPLACRFQETVESRFTKLCGVQYLAGFFCFFFYSKLPEWVTRMQKWAQTGVLLRITVMQA